MKRLTVLLASVFMVATIFARNINGVVLSSEDNLPIPGVSVVLKNSTIGVITDFDGKFTLNANDGDVLVFSFVGMKTQEYIINGETSISITLEPDEIAMEEVIVSGYTSGIKIRGVASLGKGRRDKKEMHAPAVVQNLFIVDDCEMDFNTEGYTAVNENGFRKVGNAPLSTFSIDVDAASYANVRRFLMNGQKPPKDAVRIEEMINYFSYDYKQPENAHPFAINQEVAPCPWNNDNLLLHIGLQGEKIAMDNLPASNIVFLLDVSGSMSADNKLPLLKKSLKMLVEQLREEDRVAIVVYAGSSGLVLPSTSGDKKSRIIESLERLNAGGSTAGAAGLKLAYQVASENFIDGGNNRIILATDGDFNVGQSSNAEMERLIEKEREKGIFISVLGFGMGNYKDDKMEVIADKGNGNYAYIDNILEAKKVLVNEFGGTLFTIAKDVKIQIEFNPTVVASYRLIGYENRLLNDEDFEDDKKDAGELGSGHTVTALYEIELANGTNSSRKLKYQQTEIKDDAANSGELATVKFRYKKPDGEKSILMEEVIPYTNNQTAELSENFKFSAAVAGFGMLLRDSEYKGNCDYDMLIDMAQQAKGNDEEGYRSEFIRLVKLAEKL